MPPIPKQKACVACTESKRRCDKGLPSCTRCDERDIDCHYPPAKRRRHHAQPQTLAQDAPGNVDPVSPATAELFALDAGALSVGLWSTPWVDLPYSSAEFNPSPPTSANRPQEQDTTRSTASHPDSPRQDVVDVLDRSKWFFAPCTWRIDKRAASPRDDYPTSVLTNFTRGMQTWIHRWVLEGHNPFIHRSLYAEGRHFPSSLQDAYTSASLYHHKTPQNEAFVYRILDERVTTLLAAQPVADEGSLSVPLLETRDHLARVQALFVYTVIRLFDGSVSQRAAAEVHLPTLFLWCRQLWDAAVRESHTLSTTLVVPVSKYCPDSSDPHHDTFDVDVATWNLWVLCESIRRTWLIVTCTIGVYTALKDDMSECPGGAIFTARAGLWDAPSAPRWAALRRELAAAAQDAAALQAAGADCGPVEGPCDGSYFVATFNTDQLLVKAAAADVDEFGRHLFTLIWGLDRIESWALRTASSGEVCLTY